MSEVTFRKIGPGLYERVNTPRRVQISQRFADAVRAAGNPILDQIIEQMIREDAENRNLRKKAN